jgi:hypothetical protein
VAFSALLEPLKKCEKGGDNAPFFVPL